MIDLKHAIIGTDVTQADPRKLLLEAGVQAFRVQAGYQAGKVDSGLFQHTLEGSKVLIETDVQEWVDAWYKVMDDIIDVLYHDEMYAVWYFDLPSWNKKRLFIESVINRANIRRVPEFWQYVFSQKDPECFAPMEHSALPEYPRNDDELMALYEKYGVQP